MLLNCGVGEDSWESLGLQGDPTSPSWRRSVLVFIGRTDAEAELQYFGHLMRRADSLEKTLMLGGIGVGGEGGDRGWDGWMASPTRWAWVWVNSRSWWWTGRPGVLRFMGSQSWTRLSDWTELKRVLSFSNRFFSNKLFLWRWFKHWDYLRTSSRVSKGLLVLCPKREVKAERLWAGNQSAVLLGQGRPRERPWGEELLTWPKALKSFVCLFSLVSFFCNILSSESFSVTLWICRIFKTFQLELTEWEFLQQLLHVMTMTMGLIIKSMCLVKRTMFILCMSYLLGT